METGEGDEPERTSADERITRLHEVATELQSVSTETEVYEAVIDAAVKTLGFDACAVSVPADGWFDERVVSESAPFDEGTQSFRLDEGIIGKAFQSGESIIVENALENEEAKPSDESIVSGISVPLDDKGVFQGYSSEVGAFDASDAEVADLLCAHATAALDRIERDRKLKRKNEQLEQFASFVSHDLRNPLNVAALRLELLREECDSDHLDDISRAIARMETLIDDMLTLARGGDEVDTLEPVELANVAERSWQTAETKAATLTTHVSRVIQADSSRLQQLLENLYRNAVEHGGADVTVSVGEIADGFYVADTGPGIPESDRDEIFEAGYSTTEDGTGFGLRIVEQVTDAHGWDIAVTESEEGGVRFEITGVDVVD